MDQFRWDPGYKIYTEWTVNDILDNPYPLKFGYYEKATKFEKIFHLKFDITEERQVQGGRFFQILWPFQKTQTLTHEGLLLLRIQGLKQTVKPKFSITLFGPWPPNLLAQVFDLSLSLFF